MNNTPQKQRRQRATLSCHQCRRRKLKCDRLMPCNRCIKGGVSHACAYGSEKDGQSQDPPTRASKRQRGQPSQTTLSSESDYNLRRGPDFGPENMQTISENNSAPNQWHHMSGSGWPYPPQQERKDQVDFLGRSPNLKGVSNPSLAMGMLKGRSYGTFFYGASSPMSIIAHFPDLRSFMKEAYNSSSARCLSQDMKASEDLVRPMKLLNRTLTIPSLRSLLPGRSTVDILVQKYLETFETTLRIVHIPEFKKAYEAYWTNDNAESSDMDALILMILACTICTSTHDTPRYNHTGSTHHTKAVIWIRACESWLKRQSNKHKTLASLQIRCLRLLALATTSLKVKEYYQEVQGHMGLMRSCGMHRDPSIFGNRCTIFEGEIRRRLWATSLELELQASVDKGTSSGLSNHDFDCAPPRNLNDAELCSDLDALPQSQDRSVFTDTSYLCSSMQTLELRIKLCSEANSLKSTPSKQILLENESMIRQQLEILQHWTEPRSLQAQTLLQLQLREFQVVLHTPRALQLGVEAGSDTRYYAITALEAAAKTIDLHTTCMNASNFALCLTRLDYFRAALLMCHVAYYALEKKDALLSRFVRTMFEDSMSKALRLQEERATRPGRGTKYLWYLSAAVSLVGLRLEPSKSEKAKHQAVDRVSKLLHKQLSLQDEPSAESLASEVYLGEARNSAMNVDATLGNMTAPLTAESFSEVGLQLDAFGLNGTPSDGMFGDFWFFNDVPTLDLSTHLQSGLY